MGSCYGIRERKSLLSIMKVYGMNRCLAHHSLQLGASWRCVVTFTHTIPMGKNPRTHQSIQGGSAPQLDWAFRGREKPRVIRIKKCFLEIRYLNSEGYYR